MNVPNYESVIYKEIYPGIDLKYYSYEGSLKYDFIVEPGADPSTILMKYQGMDNVEITSDGDIKVQTDIGCIYERSPLIYQTIEFS